MTHRKTNYIHPTAIVDSDVIKNMGTGNWIGPYCNIRSGTLIGDDNIFEGFCSIGTPPEFKGYQAPEEITNYLVRIGSRNKINEFTTINQAMNSGFTFVGDDCYIMRGVHIGHDARIEDKVTLSCNVIVGGHSHVLFGANCGLGSIIHQKRVVGAFAMIGMNSTVTKSIKPYCTAVGSPCKEIKINSVGMERAGFETRDILWAQAWFQQGQEKSTNDELVKNDKVWHHIKTFIGHWNLMGGK